MLTDGLAMKVDGTVGTVGRWAAATTARPFAALMT